MVNVASRGSESYSIYASPEWRASCIRNLKIGHAKTLSLLQEMLRKAGLGCALRHLVTDFVHELRVEVDVFLPLPEHLCL